MNDQQRTETAADNCEVLRARLARYEDSQGVPLPSGGGLALALMAALESVVHDERVQSIGFDNDDGHTGLGHGVALGWPGRLVKLP